MMMVKLEKANIGDCKEIYRMQVQSFQCLFAKYKDSNTSPAAEPLERTVQKMNQAFTDYYFIRIENITIGAIRIVRLEENICRISPMFILPEYQGKGYAQQAVKCAESLYPQTKGWTLDTIKEEAMLCHLYEKLGYRATGKAEVIQDNMTIVYYEK